jgi:hypothetical protein
LINAVVHIIRAEQELVLGAPARDPELAGR